MSNTIIEARDVCFSYEGSGALAVDHVSLSVEQGEFLAILGRNGSGKSTFAKLLNALQLPTSGTLTVNGITPSTEDDCYEVRKSCGMVFQNPDNQIVTTIVEEDCAFGLENLGTPPEEIRGRVDDALHSVGMSEFAQASPSMLSGGQKQRVAVAGVLAMRRLNVEEGITVVWITHFMEEAALADRLAVMESGRIALMGAPREVFAQADRVLALGLDVPEMMKLARMLKAGGLKLPEGLMTVNEMAHALTRLRKSGGRPCSAPESAGAHAPQPEGDAVIDVKHLTHVYLPGTPFEAKALSDVSLAIRSGEFVGIIGHTGSGKSTLITHLNGLERSEPGTVFVLGAPDGGPGVPVPGVPAVRGDRGEGRGLRAVEPGPGQRRDRPARAARAFAGGPERSGGGGEVAL